MPGCQFIHLETYALRARLPRSVKGGGRLPGKRSALAVLSEAGRLPGHFPHIQQSLVPVVVQDESTPALLNNPMDLMPELLDGVERVRDPLGRKLRGDAQILLGGVVSYPIPLDELRHSSSGNIVSERWINHVVRHLRQEFGCQLRCVVKHLDEGYLHLHFYVVPAFSQGHSNLDHVHPGFKASAAAVRKSDRSASAKKLRSQAYNAAMRAFQERFFSSVSIHFGQTRLGPKRRRLSPSQWRAEQAQAESLLHAKKEAESALESARDTLRAATLERNRAIEEIDEMRAATTLEAQRYIGKLRSLVELLLSWVKWMERKSIPVPERLRDAMRIANDGLDHHGP